MVTTVANTGTTTSATGTTSTATTQKKASDISKDQFLQLFSKQLQYQDPTKPTDTDAFLQQLASFSTVEGIQNMRSGIDGLGPKLDELITASKNNSDLTTLQSLDAGAALLGKTVKFGTGADQVGTVSEIRPEAGHILVRIGETLHPICSLTSVSNTPATLAQ